MYELLWGNFLFLINIPFEATSHEHHEIPSQWKFDCLVRPATTKLLKLHSTGPLLKGLRMVARALWRSEARRVVPWSETLTSRRRVQGRSQGTTLSASDLHNARATILNPFYNMEYKMIKKISQNTAWIEADILGKNLTPNWCNALAPAIVYVSNDVTIPFNTVTSQ